MKKKRPGSSRKLTSTRTRSEAAAAAWRKRKQRERAEFKRRSEASKRGWKTRRRNEKKFSGGTVGVGKKRKEKPTPPPVLPYREWLVFISYKKRPRGFHADLLMGSDDGDVDSIAPVLADQARKPPPVGLPERLKFLANWIEGGFVMIAKGQPTDRRFTKVRAFERYR